MTIFDLVTADDIVAYWNTKADQEAENLLGDELWDSQQKLGLDLKWIKGSKGLPVVLMPSAYDVAALKIDRIGFEKVSTEMPFFKNSVGIDEELRQQLNMVLESGNQTYIDAIMNRVFDDEMRLLRGARAQRERMRMSLLTTGIISISANGQDYYYDYGMPQTHKVDATTSWKNASADITGDIQAWQDLIEDDYGERPTRAVVSSTTLNYFVKNTNIRNAILKNDTGVTVPKSEILAYILSEFKLSIGVYSKKYINEVGQKKAYMPDDLFVMIPSGKLGTGWFGTTPEQSDLMSGTAANVAITDTGVAVTTSKKVDPVNVDTKVSMIYLPSFETIDGILQADVDPS